MIILIAYLLVLNITALLLMHTDKQLARRRARRIPERRLFGTAALGGAAGIWLGMQLWRHKTKHSSFVIGIPLLLIVNAAAVWAVVRLLNDGW
ncbi:DUF1294 domain-containing protein [Paenibacillus pinihumi]|uniref:DUF1294 domain-containing protein n=1 Tax=Paenibacillus pinihumi TaxID=669462 RepID=UPI0003FABABD|nr:DUF1294 domain-containing protein [Paenibacillus pinihumi]